MSTTARFATFVAVVASVFLVALAAGNRFGSFGASAADHHETAMTMPTDTHAHGGARPETGSGSTVPGLAVSEAGLTLDIDRTRLPLGRSATLSFSIVDSHGDAVREFEVEHTKRMHVIVVRRDMAGFQHLHPVERNGVWSVPITVGAAGTYRVFADFSTNGSRHVLASDLQVDGRMQTVDLSSPAKTASVDGYTVSIADPHLTAEAESDLRFTIRRGGETIVPQPYLGALGHLVALRSGDLAFLHVHPNDQSLQFMATFPTAGSYRLFLQFTIGDTVHTAPFTVEVGR